MRKRILAALFAMIMLASSIQITAFADNENSSEEAVKGDAVAIVEVYNPECVQIDNLKDLSLVIGLNSNPEFGIEIPVEAVELDMDDESAELTFWLGYKEKAVEREVLAYLAELQGDIFEEDIFEEDIFEEDIFEEDYYDEEVEDSFDQMSALLNEVEISVKGLPEGHYTIDAESTGCMIITQEIIIEIISIVEELIAMLYPEIDFDQIEGFKGLAEAVLAQEEMTLDEVIEMLAEEDPVLAQELEQLFTELDEALAYMTSEDFPGLLIAGAYLNCTCPETEYYEIIHEYYKKTDGVYELAGYVYEGEDEEYFGLEGLTGDIIKAETFVNCEYEGLTYEYVGSYNSDIMFEDAYELGDWTGYELDEFVLGDEEADVYGLILRYEIEEENSERLPSEDVTDDTQKEESTADREAAPPTGDVNNMLLYMVMAAGALSVIIRRIVKKRI